jgi:hypothetical protein
MFLSTSDVAREEGEATSVNKPDSERNRRGKKDQQ